MFEGLRVGLDVEEQETNEAGFSVVLSPLERRLLQEFNVLVHSLSFEKVMHLARQDRVPKSLDSYRLEPFIAKDTMLGSLHSAGIVYYWPDGVKFSGKFPYLDTALGIGLVFNDELHAISSAGMLSRNGKSMISIKQLQGTIEVGNGNRLQYQRSGLHNGILWRETLVQTWIEIAKKLGVDMVAIQGAANCMYNRNEEIKGRLVKGYDIVAHGMGFDYDTSTLNWFREADARSFPVTPS